jgi:hypothetical protein
MSGRKGGSASTSGPPAGSPAASAAADDDGGLFAHFQRKMTLMRDQLNERLAAAAAAVALPPPSDKPAARRPSHGPSFVAGAPPQRRSSASAPGGRGLADSGGPHERPDREEAMRYSTQIASMPVVDVHLVAIDLQGRFLNPMFRPLYWQLLLGYLPKELDERPAAAAAAAAEYQRYVRRYYDRCGGEAALERLRSDIGKDVPRTSMRGFEALFRREDVQALLRRALFVWAVRNPRLNYYQGLNDVCAVLMLVLMTQYTGGLLDPDADLGRVLWADLEVATHYCLMGLTRHIGDRVIGSRGFLLATELVRAHVRVADPQFDAILLDQQIYLGLSSRHLICLLARELPLLRVVQLWDNYISLCQLGPDGFYDMHLAVCAAFLLSLEEEVRRRSSNVAECAAFSYIQEVDQHVAHWRSADVRALVVRARQLSAHLHEAVALAQVTAQMQAVSTASTIILSCAAMSALSTAAAEAANEASPDAARDARPHAQAAAPPHPS